MFYPIFFPFILLWPKKKPQKHKTKQKTTITKTWIGITNEVGVKDTRWSHTSKGHKVKVTFIKKRHHKKSPNFPEKACWYSQVIGIKSNVKWPIITWVCIFPCEDIIEK